MAVHLDKRFLRDLWPRRLAGVVTWCCVCRKPPARRRRHSKARKVLNGWRCGLILLLFSLGRYGGGKLSDWSERSTQSITSWFCPNFTVSSGLGKGEYPLSSRTTTTPLPPLGGTSALSIRKLLTGL